MKDVNIYIYTEYTGNFAKGNGKYHVILETKIQDMEGKEIPWTNEDGSHPKPIMGKMDGTTRNLLELEALEKAMERIIKPSNITIYTDSCYITSVFENAWIDQWKENGFQRKGKDIKHADVWKKIAEQMEQHKIMVVRTNRTEYTKYQQQVLTNQEGAKDEH